jgi:ornithine--oxo-acid transaminase
MSDEPQYRDGFGPFPPGFRLVEYGNIESLENAINANTAAFLVEPVQGEGGIIVPPAGYLKAAKRLCEENNVLLLADEIQTGLGRTGKMLAVEHEGVQPDGLILGKALGGGILPVSMFLARHDVMDVFTPGDHGSTFGGNPLAAAVGLEALNILVEEDLPARSATMGKYLLDELRKIDSPLISEIRGLGLFVGIDIDPDLATARVVCEALLERGLLSKETHETVVRLAPPLIIEKSDIDWAVTRIRSALDDADRLRLAS